MRQAMGQLVSTSTSTSTGSGEDIALDMDSQDSLNHGVFPKDVENGAPQKEEEMGFVPVI